MPQSVLDSGVVRLTELTINQHELIDLAAAVSSTSPNNSVKSHSNIVNSSSISHLFDDMDFMQLKTVELHCLGGGDDKQSDHYVTSSSTSLHHNGG